MSYIAWETASSLERLECAHAGHAHAGHAQYGQTRKPWKGYQAFPTVFCTHDKEVKAFFKNSFARICVDDFKADTRNISQIYAQRAY